MVSTVTSKPNHYERLGIAPDAGDAEIARAFAVAMSPLMPRTVGDIAEIALAFETLRDPAKRRAYDESIAPPPPEPELELELETEPKLMFPREGWPFTASARIGSAELPAIDELPRSAPKAEPEPFIASPEPQRAPEPEVEIRRPAAEERFRYVEQAPVEWRRPAAMVAAVFGGVALLGAGLGWYASRGISPAQAEQAVTFPVPRAEAPVAEPPMATPPKETKATPERRTRPAAAPARARPASPPPEPVLTEEKRAEDVPDIPSEQVAALAAQADDAPAAMPLPDSVVARTIRRIGYACGAVDSTIAVEGSPGVFKVTCSSGDTYKATPVRGRYHFRRWGGN